MEHTNADMLSGCRDHSRSQQRVAGSDASLRTIAVMQLVEGGVEIQERAAEPSHDEFVVALEQIGLQPQTSWDTLPTRSGPRRVSHSSAVADRPNSSAIACTAAGGNK